VLEFESLLNAKLHIASDRPRIDRHDVGRTVIKRLVSMGLGISLVLECNMGVTFAGLVYRELRDGTGPSRISFSAVWREDNRSPALANFLKILSERYRSTILKARSVAIRHVRLAL
jgi:DNA-binding transcriptional LysR family regulator